MTVNASLLRFTWWFWAQKGNRLKLMFISAMFLRFACSWLGAVSVFLLFILRLSYGISDAYCSALTRYGFSIIFTELVLCRISVCGGYPSPFCNSFILIYKPSVKKIECTIWKVYYILNVKSLIDNLCICTNEPIS